MCVATSFLLDDMDPLSKKLSSTATRLTPVQNATTTKTPQSFLGENSGLVNLDNLIKPAVPHSTLDTAIFNNPFGGGIVPPMQHHQQQQQQQQQRTNLFQQQTQPVNYF